jgi:hypothetical protein
MRWLVGSDRPDGAGRPTYVIREGLRFRMPTPIHVRSEIARSSQLQERAILAITCLAAFLFFNSFGSIGVVLPAIQKQFGQHIVGDSVDQPDWGS